MERRENPIGTMAGTCHGCDEPGVELHLVEWSLRCAVCLTDDGYARCGGCDEWTPRTAKRENGGAYFCVECWERERRATAERLETDAATDKWLERQRGA